jgi:uncharacterized HAD superfamily protein
MKIVIDIDGVITDFVETFVNIVKTKYGKTLRETDIVQHDLYKVLGIEKDEALMLIKETLSHDLKPQIGAIEAICELSKSNEILLVTGRPKSTYIITKKWLAKHKVKYSKLIFLSEGCKHELKDEPDVVIDDHLEEIIKWVGIVPLVIVFNHPWNQSLNVKNNFTRVNNWKQLLKILKSRT